MKKYTEEFGDNYEIIKTSLDISDNLSNSKYEFNIDKNKYDILEYTKDYMKNILDTIEIINNKWNNLINIAKSYHDELSIIEINSPNGINYSKGVVNTNNDYLNVRRSPNGEILSSLPPKSEVTILEPDQDGWTKIEFNGEEAYVCSRYLNTDVDFNIIDTGVVNCSYLNVRTCPNGNIVDTIPKNTNIQILAESHNGWTKVLYDNKIAYVSSRYIDNKEDL